MFGSNTIKQFSLDNLLSRRLFVVYNPERFLLLQLYISQCILLLVANAKIPEQQTTNRMSKKTTLEDLRQKTLERRKTLRDEIVSVKSLMMDPEQPGRMIVSRGEGGRMDSYAFDDRVYSQCSSVVYGLPGAYVKKLIDGNSPDPGLAALNFNFWVNDSKDREVLLRFQRRGDEDVIRCMKPGSWNPIPYESSLEMFINNYGPEREVLVERFDDDFMILNVVTNKVPFKTNPKIHVKRDDPIEWGIRFQDSDSGRSDLQIMQYTRRLVCMNGATSSSTSAIMKLSHSTKASGTFEEVQSNIRQGIELIDSRISLVAERIFQSQEIVLDLDHEGHPAAAMRRLEKDMLVTRLQQKYVLEAWDTEGETIPEASLYRLHNAVTRAATHSLELSDDARMHLQGVGGNILETAGGRYNWN